jgi:hypothetical protein
MIYLFKIVMFYSYVKLAEGKLDHLGGVAIE